MRLVRRPPPPPPPPTPPPPPPPPPPHPHHPRSLSYARPRCIRQSITCCILCENLSGLYTVFVGWIKFQMHAVYNNYLNAANFVLIGLKLIHYNSQRQLYRIWQFLRLTFLVNSKVSGIAIHCWNSWNWRFCTRFPVWCAYSVVVRVLARPRARAHVRIHKQEKKTRVGLAIDVHVCRFIQTRLEVSLTDCTLIYSSIHVAKNCYKYIGFWKHSIREFSGGNYTLQPSL